MPVAAGVAVTAWIGGGAATTTLLGATAAVAGTMVTGAITGAIIGAGVALVTGENPLKAALKGALIGGITAGVLKGVSLAVSSATTTAAEAGATAAETGAEATNTLADASANLTGLDAAANTANVSQTLVPESKGLLSKSWDFLTGSGGGEAKALTNTEILARSNVQSGIGQGLMTGVANYGTSMMASNEAKELEEWKEKQIELNRIHGSDLPDFKADTVALKLPDRWNSNLKREGLLA